MFYFRQEKRTMQTIIEITAPSVIYGILRVVVTFNRKKLKSVAILLDGLFSNGYCFAEGTRELATGGI